MRSYSLFSAMNKLYISGFPNFGFIWLKQQNLTTASFTYWTKDRGKWFRAVGGGKGKTVPVLN
jgi:hypothetical protein